MILETQRIEPDPEPEPRRGPAQHLRTGTNLVNRYLIQSIIGLGGMGAVYSARDLHFPNVTKVVAVKEMINQARDDLVRATIVRNFEREANLLATLDHPAIPRIYDYFSQDERSYLILEYVNGKDLEAILKEAEGVLPEETVIQWGIELCDVLSYLHNHEPEPIIFRDMKPSNVMVNQHHHIVLIDFGIAKPFEGHQRGTMIGTEGYSPPEQYRGEANQLADIYALGATLHHLLTNIDPRLEAPFSYEERPIRSINPDVNPQVEQVIEKALQYEPLERYQSSEEMRNALLGTARQTGLLNRMRVRPVTTNLDKESIKPIWKFAAEDEIRGTPGYKDGMLFFGSYDTNLYALDGETGKFLWKYPTEGGVVTRPLVFDGNVYFGSEDEKLHVVSAKYGTVTWEFPTEGPVRSSPHIAEGHAFFGSDDGYMYAVNTLSGRQAWNSGVGAPIRSTPLVANELLYFGTESGDFFCMDYRSTVKWRFSAKRAITSSPILSNGVVYFGSVDTTLYAIDANTGWVVWRFRLGKPTISSPCIKGNYIYTGAVDGFIYCIDIRSAKEVWTFQTDHQVTGSPIIHQDTILCGSVDGNLYCLEQKTGNLRWKFETGSPITGTPITADDIVYIGSTDKHIYALQA